MYIQLSILFCILTMVAGQILFKTVSLHYNQNYSIFSMRVLGLFLTACTMYVISTCLWVWILRFMELSKVYPFFALGFVFVAFAGYIFFNEPITLRYVIGLILIVVGLVVMHA